MTPGQRPAATDATDSDVSRASQHTAPSTRPPRNNDMSRSREPPHASRVAWASELPASPPGRRRNRVARGHSHPRVRGMSPPPIQHQEHRAAGKATISTNEALRRQSATGMPTCDRRRIWMRPKARHAWQAAPSGYESTG